MATRTSLIKLARSYSSTMAPPRKEVLEKLQARKNLFLEDNEVPVHIKGGVMDNILVKLTTVMVATGYFTGLYTAAVAVNKTS